MQVKKTLIILGALLATILFAAESCGGEDTAVQRDKSKASAQDKVFEQQPDYVMKYSPTRNTITEWGKQWEQPGKLAYTYVTDGPNDDQGGYYVFIGPPVSMCVGLTNPEHKVRVNAAGGDADAFIASPGIDSAYGGGDCSIHYGIDAVTKTVVTFSVGLGQNMIYFQQPNLRYKNAKPLATATIETAKK